MPQINTIAKFQNADELNIPQSKSFPSANASIETTNDVAFLTNLCVTEEKRVLINALGVTLYNLLQTALADINNPLNVRFKKLVEGDTYDDKVYEGLGLIAYKIKAEFLHQTNQRLSGVGVVSDKPEKAVLRSPQFLIASMSNRFITKYQSGYMREPIIDGIFIDWFGQNETPYVSLYQYLIDKKTDFPEWSEEKFVYYEQDNSFGL